MGEHARGGGLGWKTLDQLDANGSVFGEVILKTFC